MVCFWTGHRYRPDAGCQIEISLHPVPFGPVFSQCPGCIHADDARHDAREAAAMDVWIMRPSVKA